MGNNQAKIKLIKLLDARQDRMLYTYRTQEKAADRLGKYDKRRRILSLVLTTVTGGTLLSAVMGIVGDEPWANLTVASISFFATGVSFLSDYFDFLEARQKHHETAVQLRRIHNSYESLISDLESGIVDIKEAVTQRDFLQKEEEKLLAVAPRTTRDDYKKAARGIRTDEKPISAQADIDRRTPGRMGCCPTDMEE